MGVTKSDFISLVTVWGPNERRCLPRVYVANGRQFAQWTWLVRFNAKVHGRSAQVELLVVDLGQPCRCEHVR